MKKQLMNQNEITLNDFNNIGYNLVQYCRSEKVELYMKLNALVISLRRQFAPKPLFMNDATFCKILNEIGKYETNEETGELEINNNYCTPKGIEASFYTLRNQIKDADGNHIELIHIEVNKSSKKNSTNPDEWIHRTIDVNIKNQLSILQEYNIKKLRSKSRFKKLVCKKLYYIKATLKESYKALVAAGIEKIKSCKQMYDRFVKFTSKYHQHVDNNYLLTLKNVNPLTPGTEAEHVKEISDSIGNMILQNSMSKPKFSEQQSKALDKIYAMMSQ